MENFKKIKKAFFVGIGGIGVSALARLFYANNIKVSGSDKIESEITKELEKQGIKVFKQHNQKNLDSSTDLLIYSPAVKPSISERKKAKKLKIKQLSYPEALGKISQNKYTIAVSGTHGKSTTTAMLGLILDKAGLDPTVIVGSKIKHPGFSAQGRPALGWNENLKVGKSKYFLVEACEWKAHMLKLFPDIIVLTNLEKDHLDYYKNFKNLKNCFIRYVKKLPKNGKLIFNADDKDCLEIAKSAHCKTIGYSIRSSKHKFSLQIPGEFNIYNGLAARACALELGVNPKIIKNTLNNFKGIWRRFELIGADKNGYTRLPIGRQKFTPKITLISDYAHHPTAVEKTIAACKEKYPSRRLIAVFQPHQRYRTKNLFKEFTKAFDLADIVILSEIYNVLGREIKENISSKDLVKELKKRGVKAVFGKNLKNTKELLLSRIKKEDIVLIMGAGDIYNLSTVQFD